MLRSFLHPLLLLGLLAAVFASPMAHAQMPPVETEPGDPNSIEIQAERLEELIATLEDETARNHLISQLRLLLQAQTEVAQETEPRTFVGQILDGVAEQVVAVGDFVDILVESSDEMLNIGTWLFEEVDSEAGRERWADMLRTLGIALGAALLVRWLARTVLGGMRRRLANQHLTGIWHRVRRYLVVVVIDIIPIVLLTLAGYLALGVLEPSFVARQITLSVLEILIVYCATTAVLRLILSPDSRPIRLARMTDAGARDVWRRLRAIVFVMAVAAGLANAGLAMGLPWGARTAFLILVGLAIVVMAIRLIVKHRRTFARLIRRAGPVRGAGARVTKAIARNWHVVAIGFVIVAYFVYLAAGDTGVFDLLMTAALTIVVLAVARVAWAVSRALLPRQIESEAAPAGGADLPAEMADGADSEPEDDAKAAQRTAVQALVDALLKGSIFVLAAAVLIDLWLFDLFDWLGSDSGQDALSGIISVVVVLAIAYAVYRVVIMLIARAQRAADTAQTNRARRLKTLMPLLRSAAIVVLGAIALLIVLAEVGIDITPLLASAGIIGIAIGFGAQSLVKDVITGGFILIEDSIAVGDVVNVGGFAGVVEALSIRSIRLRDVHGTVHTIPFGEVATTSNLTRDFSFYVIDMGISYNEDTDRVVAAMTEVLDEMRREPDYRREIMEPLQVLGVDAFGDSAVVIKVRIKTKPMSQWTVGREYNRRVKKKFDALGIEIPFPQVTINRPAVPGHAPDATNLPSSDVSGPVQPGPALPSDGDMQSADGEGPR